MIDKLAQFTRGVSFERLRDDARIVLELWA